MTVFTESQRAGEFIKSQGNGDISREVATLASGQKVVDGTIMVFSATKLVAAAATDVTSDGVTELAGIVIGNWDASATGTNADILRVPYIARDAEVVGALLTYPEETTEGDETAAFVAALAEQTIIVR